MGIYHPIMTNIRNNFVVYAHYTIDTNELFYIGEGTLSRSKSTRNRNRWWHFKVNKHGFRVEILHSNLTKNESERIETELIIKYKNEGSNLVNICIGPMFNNHWLLNVHKELHPMYGKKRPDQSRRITEWNRQHSGINSPTYGLKRNDLVERNKNGQFNRFTKSIKCNETGQVFSSIRAAYLYLNKPITSTAITKHLSGTRKSAYGYTWSYPT